MDTVVKLGRASMFLRTPVYKVGTDLVFGQRRESVTPDDTDMSIEVTQPMVGRLDLLAYDLYGNSELWWAIAELNNLVDPITEVTLGVQLRVPRRDRLFNILTS